MIARVRALAVGIAKAYLQQQSSEERDAPEEEPERVEIAARKAKRGKKETIPVA